MLAPSAFLASAASTRKLQQSILSAPVSKLHEWSIPEAEVIFSICREPTDLPQSLPANPWQPL